MARLTDKQREDIKNALLKSNEIIEAHGLDNCVLYLLGVELERESNNIIDIIDSKEIAMKIILRQFRLNGNEKLTYIDNFMDLTDNEIINIILASEKQEFKGSSGEVKIEKYLIKNKFNYIKEFTFKGLDRKRFDFYLIKENVCIEFDGVQHYKAIEYFGGIETFIATQNNDKLKNDYCKQNKINLIRIPYTDENNIDKILDLKLKGL